MKRIHVLLAALALTIATPSFALNRRGDVEGLLNFVKKAVDANREMTQEEEIELDRGLTARVLGVAPLVADPELHRYVNRVGLWLAMQSERPDLPWRFGVINSTEVNAFAMPGGT